LDLRRPLRGRRKGEQENDKRERERRNHPAPTINSCIHHCITEICVSGFCRTGRIAYWCVVGVHATQLLQLKNQNFIFFSTPVPNSPE